jgi:hypothetical protein
MVICQYITIGIFLFLYFAYIWFAAIWCLLGAIFNPSKFIPYTVAIIALGATVAAKLLFYKLKYESLFKNFDGIIQEQINAAVQKNMAKVKGSVSGAVNNLPISDNSFIKK